MAAYILDKAYSFLPYANCPGIKGIGAYLAVVVGQQPDSCELPKAYGQGKLLGVTVHSAQVGHNVAVRKAGIARIIAEGKIERGDPVMVTPKGHVVAIDRWFKDNPYEKLTIQTVECLGFAETSSVVTGGASDDTVDVFISMHQRIV